MCLFDWFVNCCFFIVFSSPEQCLRRAIVLPHGIGVGVGIGVHTNVKVFVKVFKTSLFPNLATDLLHLWYHDTYWSKILHSTIPTALGHIKVKVTDLEFKVFVKVFKTSLFPNLATDLLHLWYHNTYWSKILRSTIPTTLGHIKVKVTDLEFKC